MYTPRHAAVEGSFDHTIYWVLALEFIWWSSWEARFLYVRTFQRHRTNRVMISNHEFRVGLRDTTFSFRPPTIGGKTAKAADNLGSTRSQCVSTRRCALRGMYRERMHVRIIAKGNQKSSIHKLHKHLSPVRCGAPASFAPLNLVPSTASPEWCCGRQETFPLRLALYTSRENDTGFRMGRRMNTSNRPSVA